MKQAKPFSLYLGIFFTSLSVMLFEISLTKIFSVTLWYHFAYLVVSLALFGLGAGGLAAYFCQDYLKKHLHRVLPLAALLQTIIIVFSLWFTLNFNLKVSFTKSGIFHLMLLYLVCSVPFVFAGLIIALTIRLYFDDVPKLYCSDLLGASTGCILFIVAISYFSGPSVVLVSALLAVAASGCFSLLRARPFLVIIISVLAVGIMGLFYLNNTARIFSIKYTKAYNEEDLEMLYEKWSPLARITVYPGAFFRSNPYEPFGWSMSKKFKTEKKIKQLFIAQDANAGTPITNFDGDLSKLEFLKYDITCLPFYLKPNAKVFIIGSGGGRDVLTALVFGNQEIVACDINPVIINVVREEFRDFAGNVYGLPQVKVKVAEARNYIRNITECFDIIQISLIDSWAATAAGAFSLAENSLYTVEAFCDYLKHLNKNGVLSITRFLFTPRTQSLRVAILARKALETMGIDAPEQHIAVIGSSKWWGHATVLTKRTPFDQAEIKKIADTAMQLDFEILYLPEHPGDREFTAGLTTKPLEDFLATSYYDLSPTNDNRPFFFQMIRFSNVLDLIRGKKVVGQTFNFYAHAVILVLLLITSILIVVFYVLPLIISRRVKFLSKSWGFYFILLGLGFMLVEIPLLQKGSLYLGHPTYSLTVVLFSMLIFSGLGSYWSGKIIDSNLFQALSYFLLFAGLFVAFATGCLEWIVPKTIGYLLGAKIAIMIFFTGVMGFFMGTAFPSGVRLLSQSHENSIPWVWALNGGASVLGSIIAMAISMSYGYRLTLMLGAMTYLFTFFIVWYLRRSVKQG